MAELDLPAGNYLAIADFAVHQNAGASKNIVSRIETSTGDISAQAVLNTLPTGTSYWNHEIFIRKVSLTASGKITLKMKGEDAWGGELNSPVFIVLRVGS